MNQTPISSKRAIEWILKYITKIIHGDAIANNVLFQLYERYLSTLVFASLKGDECHIWKMSNQQTPATRCLFSL